MVYVEILSAKMMKIVEENSSNNIYVVEISRDPKQAGRRINHSFQSRISLIQLYDWPGKESTMGTSTNREL